MTVLISLHWKVFMFSTGAHCSTWPHFTALIVADCFQNSDCSIFIKRVCSIFMHHSVERLSCFVWCACTCRRGLKMTVNCRHQWCAMRQCLLLSIVTFRPSPTFSGCQITLRYFIPCTELVFTGIFVRGLQWAMFSLLYSSVTSSFPLTVTLVQTLKFVLV